MPKLVDHDTRRTEIAKATWAALQDVGIERLRLRDIADEVGFSTGVFAHYFRDKDSVLRYAFDLAYQRANDRILESNETVSSGLSRLTNALVALVPDKKRPETVAFVSMCFGIRGISDPLLTANYKKKRKEYCRMLKSYLQDAIDDGEVLLDQSSDDILDLVFATLDGVCIATLLNPDGYSKARATHTLETMIKRLSNGGELHSAASVASSRRKRARGSGR